MKRILISLYVTVLLLATCGSVLFAAAKRTESLVVEAEPLRKETGTEKKKIKIKETVRNKEKSEKKGLSAAEYHNFESTIDLIIEQLDDL